MPKLKNTAHLRGNSGKLLLKSKEDESTAKEPAKMKRRQSLRRGSPTDKSVVRIAGPTSLNATGGRRSLRPVASKYSRYRQAQSGSSDTVESVSGVLDPQQKAKPTDGASVGKSKLGTRMETKMGLERRTLQRSPEKMPPEGNGGIPSMSPGSVPSLVLQRISPKVVAKKGVVVTSTHRAQQLLHKARNRILVKKGKVAKKARKKQSSSSASTTVALTSTQGEDGSAVASDSASMPPLLEEDDGEVGEASEEEEGGEEEGEEAGGEEGGGEGEEEEEGRPRKVKIKLPDGKAPSKAQKPIPKYKRRRRCGECANCVVVDDCGECVFCLDKPKFGGPNIKKQACLQRRCLSLRIPTKPPPTPVKRKADIHSGPASKRRQLEEGPFMTVGQRGLLPAVPVIRKVSQKQEKKAFLKLYWPDNRREGIFPVYKSALPLDQPLCHTCGSAGFSPLVVCLMCCSEFHWFCVNVPKGQSFFTCHNCWMCSVCGGRDKLVECCSCHKAFHRGCCVGAPKSGDSHVSSSKWRCTQCVKCTMCNKTASTDDNAALWYDAFTCCADCNDLRDKGNFCPVCKIPYADNDFESKMVQCAGCSHWVHSHCEDMTDEEYEVLSELPEAEVTFYCRLCEHPTMDAQWRKAVRAEVQAAFKLIMMALEKEEWYQALIAKETIPGVQEGQGTSLKSVALAVTEEKFCSVTGFVRVFLQALVGVGEEESVVKRKKFMFMKVLYQYFPWFKLPTPHPSPQKEESVATPKNVSVSLPEDLREHSYCYPSNASPTPPPTHPSPSGEQSQSSERFHDDKRACALCAKKGDSPDQECGRLLSCGVGEWVHINCAYWSAEVFVLDHNVYSGMLFNLHAAVSRGRAVRCEGCHEYGATIGCCSPKCQKSYHLTCARQSYCLFLKLKQVFCCSHQSAVAEEDVLHSLAYGVQSPVIVDMNPDKAYKRVVTSLQPHLTTVRIGSMQVDSVGELCPLSDSKARLVPNLYRCSRKFWDVTDPSKLGIYTLSVEVALDEDDDELEIELGTCDPRLDDPSLSFPTVTTIDPTSSGEAGSSAPQEGETVAIAPQTEQDMPGLTRILEQTSAPTNHHHVVRRSPVRTLLGESMGRFRIPKKSKMAASAPQIPATPPPSSDHTSSSMLKKYLNREDIHKEGVFYVLKGPGDLSRRGPDPQELWDSVVCRVVSGRSRLGLPPLPSSSVSAVRLFGLQDAVVTRLVEQLPKAEKCSTYNFRYFKPSKMSQWDRVKKKLLINPTGCARSETYSGRRSPDMFGFLMSEHRPLPPEPDLEAVQLAIEEAPQVNPTFRPGNVQNLPMPMQYRIMLKNLKETLAVHKSRIHGLGLYAKRPIEAGDMVVEYSGTVIRSCLTDKREKYYDRKGMGTYMFRIDERDVVDATMSGNEARFINHSCDPNCYSRIITVDGKKKIMIFAMRRIVPGEEITYDYKFPLEDNKLPCQCGAPRCRRFLN